MLSVTRCQSRQSSPSIKAAALPLFLPANFSRRGTKYADLHGLLVSFPVSVGVSLWAVD